MAYRIVILGGYGQFGGRIVRWLAREPGLQLIVAGRRLDRAEQLVSELEAQKATSGALAQLSAQVSARALDAAAPDFAARIAALQANLLIHTAGPFDDRTYRVARACIAAGVNYIDLADNREFVLGIGTLGDEASSKGVLVVSGASTVPAVSAAIVDHYRGLFGRIDDIDIGITPGSRAPRGLSTIESTLSYCGKPFRGWRGGQWRDVHGWQDLHPVRYPILGTRWFANCDIPDLQLFPGRYAVTGSVKFSAALELRTMQFSVWAMSWISRVGIVSDWAFAAAMLKRMSDPLSRLGSDLGGMHVHIDGLDVHGKSQRLRWFLIAGSGDGPMIPCIASIVLARKLVRGQLRCSGAKQCVDLLTLEEFQSEVRDLDIHYVVESQP